MIDLRSDTVTRPTEAMRADMAAAAVGDDVYGEDPTVRRLEEWVAELLGKEESVFVPTGTMSNQIAVRVHTEPGDLVLIDGRAHLVRSEGGGAAAVSGVTMHHLPSVNGVFNADAVRTATGVPHPFNPRTLGPRPRLVCVENTHNGGGGAVWPLEALRAVGAAARELGLASHLDGARLWHAEAASGDSARELAEPFDTVNVCFSKGLGAPVGSALAGTRTLVERARRFKQQLGGGFRQAGIVAAGAIHALEHHRMGLVDDVSRARRFADGLEKVPGLRVDIGAVQSNIVRFETLTAPAGAFATRCHALGLHMLPSGAHGLRAVFHREVGDGDLERALEILGEVAAGTVSERWA
jgi:threonine aldolase